MICRKLTSASVICLLVLGVSGGAWGATYYVSPTGSDSNGGTVGSPFASVTKALSVLDGSGGHTIYARGGTYNLNTKIDVDLGGVAGNPNKLWAYPGETPIFDFSGQSFGSSNRGFELGEDANWWHFKGLTIESAGDNGINTVADNGIFEQLVLRYNQDSGFQLHGTATNNLVLNCDSYENYDAPNAGENADGFAAKFEFLGPGNIFRGDRTWGNSDDGWDTWGSANGVLIDDCWSFDNGYNDWGVSWFAGDGNGYKLGQDGGDHVLINVLAIDNAHNGIDVNGNGYGVQVYNSTSFSNNRNWQFDYDTATHVLKNNVSYAGSSSDNFDSAVDSYNTWNGIPVNGADFVSTNRYDGLTDLLKVPRQADGSLPDLEGFLHLVAGSNLIDAGTPISFTFDGVTYNLPYDGSAPDLGAFEWVAGPALPGDYNDDGLVDAADYSVWRDHLGTSVELPNDETPGEVTEADYDVWRAHYGESASSGATVAAAVPEPAAAVLLLMALAVTVFGRGSRALGLAG